MIEPCTLVLFGASGDLTQRMIMPAIFRLAQRGLLSPQFRLIGYARTKMTDNEFSEQMRAAASPDFNAADELAWPAFAAHLSYISAEYDGDDLNGYTELAGRLEQADRETEVGRRRLFYLATPPVLFAPIMNNLNEKGLAGNSYQPTTSGWARIIIEKPFGRDLASARALNAVITQRFNENDIYRIDHFLGKEIVQNLFALRFANAIFEPVWNRNYIDHVQITATETLGMEGRGSYFETAGIVRDMIQNHLLQLCALIAIEPPAEWNDRAVRDEKVKVLRAVRIPRSGELEHATVRGQYIAGTIAGESVPAYRKEQNVAANSCVETFAALKLYIDNARWAGVPFYLRSGKRLAQHTTEIVVEFKPAPHTPWSPDGENDGKLRPNLLIVSVSPDQGILIRVEEKRPGQPMRLQSVNLDYCPAEKVGAKESPSAYEHLLLDSLKGAPMFFARADEVEAAWAIVDPIIKKWKNQKSSNLPKYSAGSSGPADADELLARDGRHWHDPIKNGETKTR